MRRYHFRARMEYTGRLIKQEWEVRQITLEVATPLIEKYHYAKGGSNTATYLHGLFRTGELFDYNCQGVAWWIPPTKAAAKYVYPQNWQGVLSLSRLVILPGVPKNACSFLLSRSMKMINREKWPALVTYADTWRGHTGGIYKATNWIYSGMTTPQEIYTLNGRVIARKAGGHTRTKAEMIQMGCEFIGRYPKHRYTHLNITTSRSKINTSIDPAGTRGAAE